MIARAAAALSLCAALAAALPGPLRAQEEDAGPPRDAAVPLLLEVGETRSLGPGKVAPVRCDDPAVAEAVDQGGLALRGLRPGTTLCSVYTAASLYVLYRVRVVAPRAPPN